MVGGGMGESLEVTVVVTVVVAALAMMRQAQAPDTREGLMVEPTLLALT